MIKLVNLTKQYGKLAAVDSLNLEVGQGEIFGFLGPNGAGKTTTIRVLMGILKPTFGEVFLGGHNIEREPGQAKAISGFIPDRPFIYEKLSGGEFLNFVGKLHSMEAGRLERRIAELLAYFELDRWRDELVEGYSHGMKQRLRLRAALHHEARGLLISKPLGGKKPHWGLVSLGAYACIFKVSNQEADKPWRSTYILVFSSWN